MQYGDEHPAGPLSGTSLRDWFAAHALAGILASLMDADTPEGHAKKAYRYADAMLNERKPTE